MRKFLFTLLALVSVQVAIAQPCPPPGFPDAGNTCQQAPLLCVNIDGYCNTINNNNQQQNFPGCNQNVLNNDEWFSFFAGTSCITIRVIPSNCSQGNNMGLQAGIYRQCVSNPIDLQCPCSTQPFLLESCNYIVGNVYWFVLDGCAGNVCDYEIEVVSGSTVPFPPVINDPVTGPTPVCAGQNNTTYAIPVINGASQYGWTLNPSNFGTMSGGNNQDVNVNWSASASGTAQLCVTVGNACNPNADSACTTVTVIPKPTATLSGGGVICNGSGGSVNLTVTFTGNAPWEFVPLLNGVPQPTITTSDNPYTLNVTQPGTWTLQRVSTVGAPCTGTVSGSSTVNEATVNTSATTVAATCGQSNGSVDLSVNGGNAPYTYSWSGGQTTQDLSNMAPGTYDVTVTDNNGCTKTQSVTVQDNTINITPSAVTTSVTNCVPPFNGSINLSVSPTNSYTYLWSNSATTEDLANVEAGTYTVTVTFGVTCTATGEYTVADQPNNPNISSTFVNTTCDLANGSVSVSVTGSTTPYTYLWSNGATTQNLSNVLAGTYDLTVTGANGCTDTESVTVSNNNPPITINTNSTANTNCNGTGNGSATLSITPPGSYTFLWSNNATTQNQSGLLPGTYTVTVTGQGSCSETAEVTVNDNPNNPVLSFTTVQSTCDLPNGSINVSVSGGTTPYTYTWSNNETTQDLSNILAGDYDITVTGANGCTDTETINVGNNNPPITVSANVLPNTVCSGNFNGSVTTTVSPSGSYTYQWSNGATTQSISGVPADTYTVTVTGQGSCSATAEFTVPENANVPFVNYSTTNSTCELANGSANVSVTGSVAPFTYLWSNGATTQNLINVVPGTYTLIVTGANGCTAEETIEINNINPPISLSASLTDNTLCGASGNGAINLTVSPPNSSYTYLWSNNATTQDLNNLPPGSYEVTVSAGGACTETAVYVINDNPNDPDLTFTQVDANCGLNNGSINLSVTGGTTPYTYVWSNGATSQDLNNIVGDIYSVTVTSPNGCSNEVGIVVNDNIIPVSVDGNSGGVTSCINNNGFVSISINPSNAVVTWENGSSALTRNNLAPGTYSVTVSAGGTCTETMTFELYDETEYPTTTADVTAGYCNIPNGSIDLIVDGGVPPYIYKWSNNATTQDLNNLGPNSYTVTVTTSLGCTTVATYDVPNNPVPIQISGFVLDNLSCNPPYSGGIDLEISPDDYIYTYKWSNNSTAPDLVAIAPGTYTVTVTLGPGCQAVETYTVENAAVAPNPSAAAIPATCGLGNGGVNLSVSGATPPYTYKWSNTATTEDLSGVTPGTYSVTVTDFFGCTATTSAVVTNNNIPINISVAPTDNTSCASPNGALDITVAPAGSGYNFSWSNAATTEDISGVPAGNYSVTVSAGTSCSASANFTINNNITAPAIGVAITPAICTNPNGGIDLTVSGAPGPYVFAWSNAATSEDLTGILPGNYTVTVTAANGCQSDSILVVPNNSSTFSLSGLAQPLTNCATNNGSVDLVVTPAGPYTYLWNNSATTQDISSLPDGIYSVTVTETGTCAASISFVVADNRSYPTLNQSINAELCNLQDGGVNLTVSGGTLPYSFNWTGGYTTEDLNSISNGTYAVTVSTSNNCTATSVAVVPDNDVTFSVTGAPANVTSCVTINGGVDISVSPADPGNGLTYTYKWSNASTTQDLLNILAGQYAVTVSAGGTCTATAAYSVLNDTDAPNISGAVQLALCGQNSGGVDLSAYGGQAPYTYLWSTGATTQDLTGVPPGNFQVTVTGANGCANSDDFEILENVVIPGVSGSTVSNTSCITNNGGISINVSPQTLTYTYQWSSGQSTQNLQGIPGGSYSVTVNAGGSCIGTASFNVPNDIVVVSLSGSPSPVACFGQATGSVNLNVNSGTTPFNYNWQPNAGNVEDLSNLIAGTYRVTVTDANGCSATTSFVVQQPASAVQISCQLVNDVSTPTSTDGKGAVSIAGGTPPYLVDWTPGGLQGNVVPGVFNISNLAQGAYNVDVTDANGCPANCSFNIGLVPCVTAVGSMSGNLVTTCGDDGCVTAVYNAAGQFLDPNDALQFILHEGSGNQIVNEIARSSSPTFCFNDATMQYGTTYYISAVAGNATPGGDVLLNAYCTVISAANPVIFYAKPVASIAFPTPLDCEQREVNLVGSPNLQGATYQWSTTNGLISGAVNQVNTKVRKAGIYTMIITVNGCKDTTSTSVVDISNNPIATISATPDDLLDCVIDKITLQGTAEGTFNANLIWYSGGNTYIPGTTLEINDPGVYQFIIRDTLTQCADTAQIVINQNLQYPPLFINPHSALTCAVTSVVLTGGSPFPGIQYRWASVIGSDTTVIGNGGSLTVSSPGVYLIIGIDPANQCTNNLSTTVTENRVLPVAEAGNPFSMKCYGDVATLSGSAVTGSGAAAYSWTTNNGALLTGVNTASPSISKPGVYQVLVTDPANGCTDTDQVLISPIDPTASLAVTQPPCFGNKGAIVVEEVVGGRPPLTFTLNGGVPTAQNAFFNLLPGTYTIVVEDAEGCSATLSAIIEEPEELVITLTPEAIIEIGDSYQIVAQVNVPVSELQSVLWTPSTGLSCDTCLTLIATPQISTQYKVEVKTEVGCRDDATLRLLVDRSVDVYIPNVFSPNGDGDNDFFTVFAEQKKVTKIHSLQVYSRWGELLWERVDFDPNIPNIGWDGKHRGQDMNPGVYVYQAEIEFIDGRKEIFKGDVTIVR